jgi:DNA polymerase-3 subunit delta'
MKEMTPHWLQETASDLERLVAQNQLPHAILINGARGTGRRWLALWLVQRLLEQATPFIEPEATLGRTLASEALPSHPDFMLLQPAPDKRLVPVDQVRAMIAFLNLTSHQSGAKVALVIPAEALSTAAANSLLKTLEEPPPGTWILLVTQALSRLPPTVVSRCLRLRVNAPGRAQATDWLRKRADAEDWSPLLDLAGGAPFLAWEFHLNGLAAEARQMGQDFEALRRKAESPAAIARRWTKLDPEFCLRWLYQRLSREIRLSLAAPTSETGENEDPMHLQMRQETLNIGAVFDALDALGEARRLMGSGLNPELQMTSLLVPFFGRAHGS